ncbi:MAG: DNA-processing protein DprA [Longimicrobiaceae bacterium]
MNETDGFFWLRLDRLPGIGPKMLWRLYTAAAARSLKVSDFLYGASGPVAERECARVRDLLAAQEMAPIEEEYATLQARRVTVLHPDHHLFPSGVVRHGAEFGLPPVLFTRGHLPLATTEGVAIVGSRMIEDDGIEFANRMAGDLARDGLNVVSGYAKGADMAGHLGSLRAGGTTTIALSLGILNFEAKSEIKPLLTTANTLIVSQFHPRARWMARNAMARNKLVCAMSRAVVVVASGPELDEQGRASGTFDTARTALAMGVPVFVLSPRALRHPPVGNAALIRTGCRELLPDDATAQIREGLIAPSTFRRLEPQIAMF